MTKKRTTPLKLAPKPVSAPPDLPTVDIKIGGETYKACFDLKTLAAAETELFLAGHNEVDLLALLPHASVENLKILFACATQRFHRDIPYQQRRDLLDGEVPVLYLVRRKIKELWLSSTPRPKGGEAKTADPSRADSADASAGSSS